MIHSVQHAKSEQTLTLCVYAAKIQYMCAKFHLYYSNLRIGGFIRMHGCSDKHTLTVWCGLLAVVQPTQLATDLVCATRTGLCVVQLQLPARQTSSSSSSSSSGLHHARVGCLVIWLRRRNWLITQA